MCHCDHLTKNLLEKLLLTREDNKVCVCEDMGEKTSRTTESQLMEVNLWGSLKYLCELLKPKFEF